MINEFKKLKGRTETRYVLEDGGSTTTGAIATTEKPLGELQRRAEPPKPRNFVAKNAKMGGAGVHKDKKKAAKQGDVKHKNKEMAEEWSKKYKSSINCSHPKGFSQKAHCAGKKKHSESMMTMEMVCEDCGMCQTHGSLNEIKKGAKDSNGFTKCWPGHHAAGTKKGKNGGQVRNCVPNEDIEEAKSANPKQAAIAIKKKKGLSEGLLDPTRRTQLIHFLARKMDWEVSYLELATDHELIKWYKAVQAGKKPMEEENNHPDEKEDKALIRQMVKRDALKKEGYGMNGYATAMGSHIQPGNGPDVSEDEDDVGQELGMAGSELYGIAKHAKELLTLIHQQGQEHGLEAWQQSKITKAADYLTAVLQSMDYDANVEQDIAEDAYMMELATRLAEKIPKGASVDYYIKDFAKSTAPQFKNKNPAKRKQMAIAAWYDSKRKK
jgi:predicted RNA-binding protein Jag